jgi:hypothetical protein
LVWCLTPLSTIFLQGLKIIQTVHAEITSNGKMNSIMNCSMLIKICSLNSKTFCLSRVFNICIFPLPQIDIKFSSRIEDYSNSTCRNNFECALHLKYMFLMIIMLKLNINLRQGKDTYVEDT